MSSNGTNYLLYDSCYLIYCLFLSLQIMIRSIFLYLDRTYAVPHQTLPAIWYGLSMVLSYCLQLTCIQFRQYVHVIL